MELFINGRLLTPGVSSKIPNYARKYNLFINDGSYYTVIYYDVDERNYLHYLAVNVTRNSPGYVISKYSPVHRKDHSYRAELYKQNGYIKPFQSGARSLFDKPSLIRLYGLELEEYVSSYVQYPKLVDGHDHFEGEEYYGTVSSPGTTYTDDYYHHDDVGPMYDDLDDFHHNDFDMYSKEESVPFKTDNNLNERQQKYCSCVLKVEDKRNVNNPYAVCAKSTRTSSKHCGESYDFDNMKDKHIIAYANLRKGAIPIPVPYNRQQLIENIKKWKAKE